MENENHLDTCSEDTETIDNVHTVEQINDNEPVDEPVLKPKKQKTEAQLLAWDNARLKGQETLRKKREEKAVEFDELKHARLVLKQERLKKIAEKRAKDIKDAALILAERKKAAPVAPVAPVAVPVVKRVEQIEKKVAQQIQQQQPIVQRQEPPKRQTVFVFG